MHVLKNPKPVNCIHGSDRQLTHLLVRSETALIFRLWASSRMYKSRSKRSDTTTSQAIHSVLNVQQLVSFQVLFAANLCPPRYEWVCFNAYKNGFL